jgi:hypothetical protein
MDAARIHPDGLGITDRSVQIGSAVRRREWLSVATDKSTRRDWRRLGVDCRYWTGLALNPREFFGHASAAEPVRRSQRRRRNHANYGLRSGI